MNFKDTEFNKSMSNDVSTSFAINWMKDYLYNYNVEAGWYTDPLTNNRIHRNIGEMLCLIHSEISEAMEGHRKNLQDDKLPHRTMLEVELADAFIRICDLAGYLELDLGGAVVEKHLYNRSRLDHKLETRAAGGKKF